MSIFDQNSKNLLREVIADRKKSVKITMKDGRIIEFSKPESGKGIYDDNKYNFFKIDNNNETQMPYLYIGKLDLVGVYEQSITIGDYKFTLVAKFNNNNREHVSIKYIDNKTKKTEKFSCYRSNSEGGFWRACIIMAMRYYHKGADYVTSSFIDIYLQNFINQQYAHLPQDEESSSCYIRELGDILDDTNRIQRDDILDPLQYCRSGECFKNNFQITEYINSLKNDNYQGELKKSLEKIDTKLSLNETIKKIYQSVSDYIEKYFTVDLQTIKKIGTYIFKYSNDVIINHNFYEIQITNTKNNIRYKLFYTKYRYENKENTKYNGEYYAIINIIPTTSKTNQFGLYDKIMSVGIYIYKIIEYKSQCNIDDKNREISITDAVNCYTFIGDFMTNIFPLNKIQMSSEQATQKSIEGAYASEWQKGKYGRSFGEGMSVYFEDEGCQAVFILMDNVGNHIIVTKKDLGV
ncbi:MAG: hypothetical protein WD512_16170, partial [Candidatus Paceibacterota bacterium]